MTYLSPALSPIFFCAALVHSFMLVNTGRAAPLVEHWKRPLKPTVCLGDD